MELRSFKKGEYLCHQDENLELLYFLLEGELQVDYFRVDGGQTVFSFEKPFSIIGDLELFEHCKVLGNVQALKTSLVFTASIKIIRKHGYNNAKFLRYIMHSLVKKLFLSSTLHSQTLSSVEFRLARYLLFRMEKDGKVIQLEKRESLAAILGTSTRHLNRMLKQLIVRRSIEVHNKTLKIVNLKLIKAIVEKET